MPEFVNPGVLWALPAATLPVVIHLLNRLRYRRVQWAAMMHLVNAERRSRRRVRWQNVVLMALRCAAVGLLVLLFARPYSPTPLLGDLAPRGDVVVLLDDSASMAQRRAGVSCLERAAEFAGALAEGLAATECSLAVYVPGRAAPLFEMDAPVAAGADRLRALIGGLPPAAAPFEPGRDLQALGRQVAGRSAEQHFYVVTDLRSGDWGEGRPDPDAAGGLRALQEHGPVTVVDVGADPTGGTGVTALSGGDNVVYAPGFVLLRAALRNGGRKPVTGAVLNVWLDGQPLPGRPLPDLRPGESHDAALETYLSEPGHHTVRVALDTGDPFPSDDDRWLAIEAVRTTPVLVVEGGADSAHYLRAALAPGAGDESGVRLDVRAYGDGPAEDLAGYRAVFLSGIRSPAAWEDALRDYVERGGRLVVFLGEEADPAAWNETLPGGGASVGEVVASSDEGHHLTALDVGHPVLRPFREWQTLFGAPRFRAFRRLSPMAGADVLMRFDDEAASPALVTADAGRGDVFVFATSADDDWSDWPRSEAGRVTYVALLHRLVDYGTSATPPELNLVGGERLELRVDPATHRPDAELLSPSGKGLPLSAGPVEGREDAWLLSEDLREAGAWTLRLTWLDGGADEVHCAVNVPEHELDLRRTDPGLLADAEMQPGHLAVLPFGGGPDAALTDAAAPVRYWPYVAAALVLLLLAESLLAFAFGNPRAGGRP